MFPTYLLASLVLVALTFMLRFRTEWKTWAAAFYRVGIFSAVSVLILPLLWLVLKCVRVRFPSMLQDLGPRRFSLWRVWNYVTVVLFIAIIVTLVGDQLILLVIISSRSVLPGHRHLLDHLVLSANSQ